MFVKYKEVSVVPHIIHDLRDKADGETYSNASIVPSLKNNNYSLICRGKNTAEVNAYRKEIEKEIYVFKRSNMVHAVEVSIHLPDDCPPEEEKDFFKISLDFICSTLPMGERCVFIAEVHRDERHYSPSGEMISKNHLHVMFVPAVPDHKHDDYEYKLCANSLITRKYLLNFYPKLQKYLDDHGIHATIYKKRNGKVIPVSVNQLKELTAKTGKVFKDGITVETLSEIINDYENKLNFAYENFEESKTKDDEIKRLKEALAISNSMLASNEQKLKKIDEKQKLVEANNIGWGSSSSNWESVKDNEILF